MSATRFEVSAKASRALLLGLFIFEMMAFASALTPPPRPLGPDEAIRIAGAKEQANRTKYVAPAITGDRHAKGDVKLLVWINKKGLVEKIKVISGSPVLVPAVTDAVRQWEYKPFLLNGNPYRVETTVTIKIDEGKVKE